MMKNVLAILVSVVVIGGVWAYQTWGRHPQPQIQFGTDYASAAQQHPNGGYDDLLERGEQSRENRGDEIVLHDDTGRLRTFVTHDYNPSDPNDWARFGDKHLAAGTQVNSDGTILGQATAPPDMVTIDCCPAMKAYLSPDAEDHLVQRIVHALKKNP